MSGKHDVRTAPIRAVAFAKKHKEFVVVSKLELLSHHIEFIAGLMNRKSSS
jgi:hypothetical protein